MRVKSDASISTYSGRVANAKIQELRFVAVGDRAAPDRQVVQRETIAKT
jgi:hypothetical protein